VSLAARFTSNLVCAVAGGLLLVVAFAFSPATGGWLALGGGCVALVTVLGAFAVHGRGPPARTVDALLAIAAAWTIVASRVFDGRTLRWLSFADGAALCSLAVVGLIVHEALVRREVRVLRSLGATARRVFPVRRTAA
jgi:hypothetical protein